MVHRYNLDTLRNGGRKITRSDTAWVIKILKGLGMKVSLKGLGSVYGTKNNSNS